MDTQLLRNAILLQLEAALPASLPLPTLQLGLQLAACTCCEGAVLSELQYLMGKGLVTAHAPEISPEALRYRITAKGRDVTAGASV